MLVYKPIECKNCLYEFCIGLTVVCSTWLYVRFLSRKYFRLFRLHLWQQVHVNSSKKVNINTSYSLHLSFSWGTSNFWFVGRMSSSNLFYESPREHMFTVISYYWVSEGNVPHGMSISSHFARLFHKKEFVNQQLTIFLRRCDTCNYLKAVICNAFRYFMTVRAHSVVRPEKLWPIRVCQVYVLLASSIPFLRCSWLHFNRLHLLMTKWMNDDSARFFAKS